MPVATQAGVFGIGLLPSCGPRAQLRLQVARRHAEQRAERVVGLPERDLQRRDGRTGLLQDGPRLLHVEPGRGADPEFLLGEGQDALLDPDVVPRDLDPLLGDPILHVVRGHVRQQGHQGCVIVLHRSIQAGIVRLDVPADAAPQVELPAQVEAVEPVGERERAVSRLGATLSSGPIRGMLELRLTRLYDAVACWVWGKMLPTAIAWPARASRTRVPAIRRVGFCS